jgi:hypothetical protein
MRTITLLVFVVFASCTSTRPLTDQTLTEENLIEQLMEDRIWVLKKDGEEYKFLKIESIEEDYLLCYNNKYENLIIPYSSIEEIKTYHPSPGKTIGLVVGIPVVLYIIAWISCQDGCGATVF